MPQAASRFSASDPQRAAGRRGLGVDDVVQHIDQGADNFIWESAVGQNLVEDDAQCVDIGADIDRTAIAAGLFGGGILHFADELPGHGDISPGGGEEVIERGAGEAKVQNMRFAIDGDENV